MKVSDRKRHGVVYTPAPVVDLILDHVLPLTADELAEASICDPSCGDGAFLVGAARRILTALPRSSALAALGRLAGYDINAEALAISRVRLDDTLTEWYPDSRVDWLLENRNALDRAAFQYDAGRFTHVVGNPPYVRVQHLEETGRSWIAGQWDLIRGATDLYLVFYELGLHLLASGGVLGYITPSSWMRSDSGSPLRRLLALSHKVVKIIDYGYHQVFDDVTTYTAIVVIQKDGIPTPIPVDRYYDSKFYDAGLIMLDEGASSDTWVAETDSERERLADLMLRGPRLSSVADIHVGIQTLADSVFIRPIAETDGCQLPTMRRLLESGPAYSAHLPWHTDDGTKMMERWIMRPIVKASVLKDSRDPVQRAVLFPYDDLGTLLPEKYIEENAPTAYEWLLSHKQRLLNRDKGRFDPARWYAFGRHVSITSGFGPKILTSGMNLRPNFQMCPNLEATFYSGYCIKPHIGVDCDALLECLNSPDMEFFIQKRSRPYQGGWMSYAKSFIKDYPVAPDVLGPDFQSELLPDR